MKKSKIKISIVCTMIFSVLLLFSACSSSGLSDTYVLNNQVKTVYTNSMECSVLNGYSKKNFQGDLFYGTKQVDSKVDYIVYNIKTKNVVYVSNNDRHTQSISLKTKTIGGETISYFTVQKKEKSSGQTVTVFYNYSGQQIAYADNETTAENCSTDLIKFNKKYYQVQSDGHISLKFGNSDLSYIPASQFTYYNNDYYYYKSGTNIFVYNQDGHLEATCSLPTYAENILWAPLSSGKVLIQYVVSLDDNNSIYDYIEEGKKYTLYTKLFVPQKNKLKNIRCDVKYLEIYNNSVAGTSISEIFNSDIKNIGWGYKIKDKRLNKDDEIYEIKDNGKCKEISKYIEGQEGVAVSRYNKYFVQTKSGNTYLYDSVGNFIGDVTGMYSMNSKFIVTSSAIYDHDLKELYAIGDNFSISRIYEYAVVLRKTVDEEIKYYIYDGTLKEISGFSEKELLTLEQRYFVINSDGYYVAYNESGARIASFAKSVSTCGVCSDQSCSLVYSDNTYYIFS